MPRPRVPSPIRRSCFIATCLLALCHGAVAQTVTPLDSVAGGSIPRLTGPIVIDGKLDDAAWDDALVQEIAYDIQPGDNIPAPVRTIVRLGYTTDALYIAYHALEPEPAAIRAHLRDRDAAFNDDWVGVFLDTFDDNRRGYEFIVNPLGVQSDLIRDETNLENQEDKSWDGLWTSAGRITAEGYDVEIRIPFSTLRFPAGAQLQKWGISLFRNYPRDKRHQLTSHRVPRESNCFQCEWGTYEGMAGVQQGRNLEIVPTLTVGQQQSREAAGESWHSADTAIEPGVDISWSPAPSMTLNATINPDFSQVETDQLQLSINDSFALFYQEKRPFFLEGADYFSTQFDVLYTRQIAEPDAGLRLTGRTDSGAYGAILARDASTLLLVPGTLGSRFEALDQKSNVAVGRYRHNIGEHATLGLITTLRDGDDYQNKVAGIDARWQQGPHTATAQVLRSGSEYPGRIVDLYGDELGADATPSGTAWRAGYTYSDRHWYLETWHQQIDPGFRADLGFMGQVGYDKSLLGGRYNWYRDDKSINRIRLEGDFDITHRYDGQLLEREWESAVSVQGPMQSSIDLHGLTRQRFWNERMFDEHYVNTDAEFRPSGRLLLGGFVKYGSLLDLLASRTGRSLSFDSYGNVNLGRGANLEWEITRQRMRRDGGTAFRTVVLNGGGSWQFTPAQRLRFTLQGSEVLRDQALYADPVNARARDWALQLVYSYKINPRTALYAGGTYGAFLDDDHPEMFANTRSLFLKISYGWQPQF